MTHTITVEMIDKVPDSILGLPKNWKIVFKDYSEEHEDNRLARYNEDEGGRYYLEYVLKPMYAGEVVAPRMRIYDLEKLKGLLETQVKKYGRNEYRGALRAVEECVGY